MRRPLPHDLFEVIGLRKGHRTMGRIEFEDHEHVLWNHTEEYVRPRILHLLAIEVTLRWLRREFWLHAWSWWVWPVILRHDRERANRIAGLRFRWRWLLGVGLGK